MQFHSSQPIDGELSGTKEIVFSVCDGVPSFFWKRDKGYALGLASYRYERSGTSHVFSFVKAQAESNPAWIETQSMALVEEPAGVLTASWSRTVSNPRTDAGDPERVFAQVAIGQLRKTSDDCGRFRRPADLGGRAG
ncbi:hypothetical protein LZ009_03390 [Ramlibacter sp. XY19]|uniref:hypothetical protein n=1 Tax=Ramlibacter paludis TaxID=2908000 RepID=UPI0023DAA069|nr:hypothetical protein [Ramlibacter paludis]MCG2591816.1 hypothetical protein [Ramlibacter paludis]